MAFVGIHDFPSRETHSSRGPSFLWAYFLHFGGLKKRLLPSRENHSSGNPGCFEFIFCILAAWECDLCRFAKPTVQGALASCELIFCILTVWKCDLCRVVKHTVQWYLGSCKFIFCILAALEGDLCRVVKPTIQGDPASWELVFRWALGFNSRVRCIAFDVRPRVRTSQTYASSPVGRPTRQGDSRGDRITTKVTLNTHEIRYVQLVEKQITKYIFLIKFKVN